MLTISAFQQNSLRAYLAKHWRSLLLLSIAQWPFSAWACINEDGAEGGSFDIFVIFLLVLEFSFAGFFLLSWWIKRKFWPTQTDNSSNFWFDFFLFSATLISIALGLFGTFLIPEFERTFANFEAKLPMATQFLFSNRHLLWLTTVPVAVLWWTSKNKARRSYYFAILCNIEIGIFIGVLWALYRPIFKMGGLCG